MSSNITVISTARSSDVKMSPYKLRLFADVIRGRSIEQALSWLKTVGCNRAVPLVKILVSAYANAKSKGTLSDGAFKNVIVHRICVNEAGFIRYVRPGARGRGCPQRRRSSHIDVELGLKQAQVKTDVAG